MRCVYRFGHSCHTNAQRRHVAGGMVRIMSHDGTFASDAIGDPTLVGAGHDDNRIELRLLSCVDDVLQYRHVAKGKELLRLTHSLRGSRCQNDPDD